jgi:competence protein ComEA
MTESSEEQSRLISRLSTVSGRDMREGSISSRIPTHALHAAQSRHSRHSCRSRCPRNNRLSVHVEESRQRAKIPRLTFSARSAAAVIFILVFALSCSVTLLVIQGANNFSYPTSSGSAMAAAPSRSRSSSSLPSRSKSHAGPGTSSANSSSGSAGEDAADSAEHSAHSSSPCSTGVCADGKININAASSQQLQTVNGIGPSTAQKIIDYRKEHGNYTTVDALINVSGIGPKKLAKMRDSLVAH